MCFFCNIYGHYANVCPKRTKQKKLKHQEEQNSSRVPVIKQVANLIKMIENEKALDSKKVEETTKETKMEPLIGLDLISSRGLMEARQ